MDLIYVRHRKGQDILSMLGMWGSWERVEGDREGRKGSGEKYVAQ